MEKPLSYQFTFASPGNAPGFNCSRQAERLVNENAKLKRRNSKRLSVAGVQF